MLLLGYWQISKGTFCRHGYLTKPGHLSSGYVINRQIVILPNVLAKSTFHRIVVTPNEIWR